MEINKEEQTAIAEIEYILKSEANRKRLRGAIEEMNRGVHYKHELIEA